jgi:urease accessory protein
MTYCRERADTVTLLFDDRYRRRLRMLGDGGLDFLLDLVEPIVLHTGDGLKLEEGGFVEVKAAEEDLVEVRGRDAAAFARIAWHLGNRHLPPPLLGDRLRIRRDHVIEAMVKGLGARIIEIEAPFDPEGGAYAASHAHAPDTAHGHDHAGHDHGDHPDDHHGDHHHHDEHCDHDHHHHDHSHAHDHK